MAAPEHGALGLRCRPANTKPTTVKSGVSHRDHQGNEWKSHGDNQIFSGVNGDQWPDDLQLAAGAEGASARLQRIAELRSHAFLPLCQLHARLGTSTREKQTLRAKKTLPCRWSAGGASGV
jgi:hypothetical protein